MGQDDTKVVQVTNVASQVTRDQLKILFGYLGEIDDIRLYPKVRHIGASVQLRICFIKFTKKSTAAIAQYINGTVLFDHALIVTLEESGEIPDEDFALAITKNGTVMPSLCSSEGFLPPHVVTRISDSKQVETFDPNLEANALPEYPPLPASYDSEKIDEVRRTVQIEDLDSNICNEDYLEFFSQVAEVNYMCRCKSTSDLKYCMLVEFSDQPSIIKALKLNGSEFKGNPIKIVHATQAIVKPDNEAMQKRIVEALSSATVSSSQDSRRSRSRSLEKRRRSRSKRRSRSRSHDRKRTHRRSRSRSRKRTSKHTGKSHKGDMELEKKRSDRKHRSSRSRSRDRKRSKSRSNSKKRSSRRKHSRSTSRDRKRDKKHDRRR